MQIHFSSFLRFCYIYVAWLHCCGEFGQLPATAAQVAQLSTPYVPKYTNIHAHKYKYISTHKYIYISKSTKIQIDRSQHVIQYMQSNWCQQEVYFACTVIRNKINLGHSYCFWAMLGESRINVSWRAQYATSNSTRRRGGTSKVAKAWIYLSKTIKCHDINSSVTETFSGTFDFWLLMHIWLWFHDLCCACTHSIALDKQTSSYECSVSQSNN